VSPSETEGRDILNSEEVRAQFIKHGLRDTVSSKRPEPLDLERDLPTTAEDVAALRRIREVRRMSFADYLRFLSRLEPPSRSPRKTHAGHAPFEL